MAVDCASQSLSGMQPCGFTREFDDEDEIPQYAILSHTWQADQEVTFDDLLNNTGKSKAGYEKLQFCAKQVMRDGLRYFWVDTCCINKATMVEVQRAINSMFRWYQNATSCYVYLQDVSTSKGPSESSWELAFRRSRWHTRTWCLQELLAPREVRFFSQEGDQLGDKKSLERQIHEITGIPTSALQTKPLFEFSVDERLSWTKGRQATFKEDKAYSLLGIFGVFMLPNYGEGEDNAFKRLRKEIEDSTRASLQPAQPGNRITTENADIGIAPWLVPFSRPRSFVGREKELVRLSAHISSEDGQRLTICGVEGVGMSTLALECAYRARDQQPMRSIFWVPAVDRASFERAYQEIATLLGISEVEDDNINIKQLVKVRLEDKNMHWLMIVDDVKNTDVLVHSGADPLVNYLPHGRAGSIIFTTHHYATASELSKYNTMTVGDLTDEEAIALLEMRLSKENLFQLKEQDTVKRFLGMLLFHPLTIIQATAFVNTNKVTLSSYMALQKDSYRVAVELINEHFDDNDHDNYGGLEYPIITTWHTSFAKIQTQSKIATEYLLFMACIAYNDIPTSVLPDTFTEAERTEAIATLTAYAFIEQREQARGTLKAFDLHPLVHMALRFWLKSRNQWSFWTATTLARLVEVFAACKQENREVWISYLPHARHVLENAPEHCETEDFTMLLGRIGGCEQDLGRFEAAERAYRRYLELQTKRLGKEHMSIGVILHSQGKYIEAEKILRDTLALVEKLFGKEHPDTLLGMHNVAYVLAAQGGYPEQLYRETLVLQKKILGVAHPDTITTMESLAVLLLSCRMAEDAELLYRELLELREEVVGKEHLATLVVMGNLATALGYRRKWKEAEQLNEKALSLLEKTRGKDDPITLGSVRSLADLFRDRKKYEEALPFYERAYRGFRASRGPDHSSTLRCLRGLTLPLEGNQTTPAPTPSPSQPPATSEVALRSEGGWRHKLKKWKIGIKK
ncbi:kinesin light chain 1 [Phaeosphaeriaceae sp. PMI808]|nr:kinesin light chain 1 [Phaeosphaeriaceae sp. PMI808]